MCMRQSSSQRSTESTESITEFDLKSDFSNNIKKVDWREVSVLSVLGQGSFSNVFKVDVPSSSTSAAFHLDNENSFVHVDADKDEEDELDPHYALKCLNSKQFKTKQSFILGVSDLVTEADILSNLNHPHIIQLQGVSSSPPSESYLNNDSVGYFLILDVLDDTLDKRLNVWSKEELSFFQPLIGVGRKRKRRKMYERIENVAIGISNAMAYLHEQRLVFRDLKPANIGFDSQGTVKLFDFGLARPVDEYGNNLEDDIAGTYRYMAPESIVGKRSALPSDVYSFGILLWEICTLMIPFKECKSLSFLIKKVAEKDRRPWMGAVLCSKVKKIIQNCWASCPDNRPSFNVIHSSITKICNRQEDNEVLSMKSAPSPRRSIPRIKFNRLPSMLVKRSNTIISDDSSITLDDL